MKAFILFCLVLSQLVVACTRVNSDGTNAKRIHPQIVFEGHRASDFSVQEGRVVRASSKWLTLQPSLQDDFALQSVPVIDFTQHSAILIFAGEKRTGGYRVQIVDVLEMSNRLLVRARVVKPDPNASSIQTITYPFIIALIPQTLLTVDFEIES